MDRNHPKDPEFFRLQQHREGKRVLCGALTVQGTGNCPGTHTVGAAAAQVPVKNRDCF